MMQSGLGIRTAKWFRVIHENQIPSDLITTGSKRFMLPKGDAHKIVNSYLETGFSFNS
jgi:hypothetical protein